ncbi:ribosomal protein S18-alanine N-acetyltransferase [Halalkalibacterium halodurans]|uniref:[Ribosomal protein bS18]-alanine N-acetyltransferase n=1 Tax=Halalkalibacterium halodurans (strain ATCC BAA-125 / DSM 18197 / FERM 7344 / JCM 9153 / C-125) TaxID=272558 RepID=Q9KFD4_HALH5|nr:ribosomal protein S18-alanine N-acetyltransferase [Halalkalibacterium halodurans]MDY7221043.1 ribosomal protein S18-alanine N-acetyltransferase [Halalkalibacterium halodurans]MDY7240282.1 ribosomal protein S18-alanine N-acetyltransferase [Halalkalibacterium halodurans]MED3645453.1 ribosomal protein S18-alanine N-acetyltransferase [Halalkalibacterium halodurans]MED4079932.1 ribosomal protein S18-alanine N-acetyltransferase [Halalkalibacterium halodurans]MED4086697.1 ribosomal protein S18-ala
MAEKKERIRFMTVDDVDAVVRVEEQTFTVPWSREAFINEVTNNQFARYVVYEVGEQIVGYCGVWVVYDESHITNIAIHPDYRGEKRGEALLRYILEFARLLGAKKLSLEVRISNEIAQRLYRKFGFQAGGIRKNYYTDNQEDALVMWVMLS